MRRRSVGSRSSGRAGKFISALLRKVILKGLRRESAALLSRMDEILGGDGSDREKVEKLNLAVGGIRVKFDPKAKIESYLDAAEDETACAFDMNEVLNPGELDLEELCKEMGLMEK